MSSIEVQESYLVHTALDERGDMVVISADGSLLDYRDFKRQIGGMRLAFPSHDAVRANPGFQVWSFQRIARDSSLWLCRSMISGSSADNRPLPVFEIFHLDGPIAEEATFVKTVSTLSFLAYPPPPAEKDTGVRKPNTWISIPQLAYPRVVNKKRKEWRKVSFVADWSHECRVCVDKLLWFACHERQWTDGISLCFTADAFSNSDVCTYYTDRRNAAILKYQFSEFG